MECKIEKGAPLPRNGAGAPTKYPWREMEIGDSFFGPKIAAHAATHAGRRFGMKFTSRKEGDGVRIWRVE